jgi:hypothetical protein
VKNPTFNGGLESNLAKYKMVNTASFQTWQIKNQLYNWIFTGFVLKQKTPVTISDWIPSCFK